MWGTCVYYTSQFITFPVELNHLKQKNLKISTQAAEIMYILKVKQVFSVKSLKSQDLNTVTRHSYLKMSFKIHFYCVLMARIFKKVTLKKATI